VNEDGEWVASQIEESTRASTHSCPHAANGKHQHQQQQQQQQQQHCTGSSSTAQAAATSSRGLSSPHINS